MECKICGDLASPYAEVRVRAAHTASVLHCRGCGFVFLDPIEWLAEAYAEPIDPTDVGYVSRNLGAREFLKAYLAGAHGDDLFFCDYAAGYGLLVRLMRDIGFRFHWHDPYCPNLFARFCEASPEHFAPYRAVTALEVFEHLPDPASGVQDILRFGSRVIFSTELVPSVRPDPRDWWYFGLDHGQHVSFYSEASLHALAKRSGLTYTRLAETWHLFEKPDPALRKLLDRSVSVLQSLAGARQDARPSLTQSDFDAARRIGALRLASAQTGFTHLDLSPGAGT